MEDRRLEHIRIRASLVVQVIDDFRNCPIEESLLLVHIDGAKKPMKKKGGYYVFLNVPKENVKLSIRSRDFQEYEQILKMEDLKPQELVIKVRLKPNSFYNLPRGTTSIKGKANFIGNMLIWCPNMTDYFRLTQDYMGQESTKIQIFNPDEADMEKRMFLIRDQEKSEFFRIENMLDFDKETFLLEQCLNCFYSKVSAQIYPVISIDTDAEGNFYVPIPFFKKEHSDIIFHIGKKDYHYVLEYGTVNRINLEAEEE